jgi:serine-type D-Ala-D-Ala carboxypeptidase/endopeptidase
LTISRKDTRMFAQLTGQPPIEIFATSERQFFYKVVNAQITFETDSSGRGVAVVLRQNGVDQQARRVD